MSEELTPSLRCPQCGTAFEMPRDKSGAWQYCPACRAKVLPPSSPEDTIPLRERGDFSHVDDPTETELSPAPAADGSHSYALSSGPSTDWSEEDESNAVNPNSGSVWPEVDAPPPLKQRRSKPASPKSGPWWEGIGKAVAAVLGIQVIGIILTVIFPSLILTMFGVYLLALVLLFGMSWMIGLQHAIKNNRLSVIFFFLIPLYPIRYGIRHWPETRPAITAAGLAFIWLMAPMIISIPVTFVGSFFEKEKPQVAEEAEPPPPREMPPLNQVQNLAQNPAPVAQVAPVAANPPANTPPILMTNPNIRTGAVITSMNSEITADGMITTTVKKSDGTVTTTVKQSLSKFQMTPDETFRRMELRNKINADENEVGTVIEAEVMGTDRELVFGGQNGIYALASSPNAAAVHAGLVKVDETAKVKITIVPSEPEYLSTEKHGILSLPSHRSPLGYKIELATEDSTPTDPPANRTP